MYEEINKAINLLKEVCQSNSVCDTCPFLKYKTGENFVVSGTFCGLNNFPTDWETISSNKVNADKERKRYCDQQSLLTQIEQLKDKLFLLTGCGDFGDADNVVNPCTQKDTDEGCDDYRRCQLFGKMLEDFSNK